MANLKKFTAKINGDEYKLYISNHNSIEGYLAVSLMYKHRKTGDNLNQIVKYELEHDIFKTEIKAIDWAKEWVFNNFQVAPNFVVV